MNFLRLLFLFAMLAWAGLGCPAARCQDVNPLIRGLTPSPPADATSKPAAAPSPATRPSATQPTSAPTATAPSTAIPTTAPNLQPVAPPWLSLIQTHADQIAGNAVCGTWVSDAKLGSLELVIVSDGRFRLDAVRGTYVVQNNLLIFTANAGRTAYTFSFDGNDLILRGGDLRQETRFVRQANLADAVTRVLEISPEAIKRKIMRIGIALSIMLVARLFILLLQGVNYVLLYSTKGPLTLLWRANKARARTVHSLILNFITYAVYFTSLGYILGELGINYTAYIASLSVIGLAIGFGSQGLVQDMVTGFFLVLESQFDVGDMVEISGQTGVVVEFGLRSTTIRNYVGQIVIIPNRNIVQVGRYKLNSQLALVDVLIPAGSAPEPVVKAMTTVGHEINVQFAGVLENDPTILSPATLETGEVSIRMHVLFWPGQNWVIEAQLVPRLRAALKADNIDVPPEKIVLFYHAHESHIIKDWRESLGWRRETAAADAPGRPH